MRLRVQRSFEDGAWRGPFARLLERQWASRARARRRLIVPPGLRVIGVGGATLGGSGKTPLVLALARCAPAGLRVAVLARSYPRRIRSPQLVRETALPVLVGDEAVMLARHLAGTSIAVWVGERQRVLDQLSSAYDFAIIDGLLQAEPEPLHCAVLSLDASSPWGSGRCPPAGDLVACPQELLSASDIVVVKQRPGLASDLHAFGEGVVSHAWSHGIVGAQSLETRRRLPVSELARLRLGLILALGRPRRVIAELAGLGIFPKVMLLRPDHAHFPQGRNRSGEALDAWLTTAKCATKLENSYRGAPVWVLEQGGRLPAAVVSRCFGRGSLEGGQAW